jgi:hypothetical protein
LARPFWFAASASAEAVRSASRISICSKPKNSPDRSRNPSGPRLFFEASSLWSSKPPSKTKTDYFANSFFDFASNGPFTALPASAEPFTSYALIRGGAFNNKYDSGNWHTRLVVTSELDDVVKVGFRNNGNAWNVLTKD